MYIQQHYIQLNHNKNVMLCYLKCTKFHLNARLVLNHGLPSLTNEQSLRFVRKTADDVTASFPEKLIDTYMMVKQLLVDNHYYGQIKGCSSHFPIHQVVEKNRHSA